MNALTDAVKAVKGGQAALARLLDVSPQAVGQWLSEVRPVPPERCPAIERHTGVRCEVLRPDLTWTRGTDGQVTGYHVSVSSDTAAA